MRGAKVAAYAFNPDLAIAVDSTPAYDLPAWDGRENIAYNTKLGRARPSTSPTVPPSRTRAWCAGWPRRRRSENPLPVPPAGRRRDGRRSHPQSACRGPQRFRLGAAPLQPHGRLACPSRRLEEYPALLQAALNRLTPALLEKERAYLSIRFLHVFICGETMKTLIQKLTETFSPSGYETAIRESSAGN